MAERIGQWIERVMGERIGHWIDRAKDERIERAINGQRALWMNGHRG